MTNVKINAPVGARNGVAVTNQPADLEAIIALFDNIAPADGGTRGTNKQWLPEKTQRVALIKQVTDQILVFQNRNKPPVTIVDGAIDPTGKTLIAMNDKADVTIVTPVGTRNGVAVTNHPADLEKITALFDRIFPADGGTRGTNKQWLPEKTQRVALIKQFTDQILVFQNRNKPPVTIVDGAIDPTGKTLKEMNQRAIVVRSPTIQIIATKPPIPTVLPELLPPLIITSPPIVSPPIPLLRRPFYLISHKCNHKGDVEASVKKGANAIECDVQYHTDGNWYVYHDSLIDNIPLIGPLFPKNIVKLNDWLDEVATVAINYKKLALIVFDIKTPAFTNSLKILVNNNKRFMNTMLYIIYSTANLNDANHFGPPSKNLMSREGFCVDQHSNPKEVVDKFKALGINKYWYANGIDRWFPNWMINTNSLTRAAELRDNGEGIKKTHYWTIESEDTAIKFIGTDKKVDGVMANMGGGGTGDYSANMLNAINKCSGSIRLATRDDDAFRVYVP
jgi:glycerophosphoryl diester phosphodiesterase